MVQTVRKVLRGRARIDSGTEHHSSGRAAFLPRRMVYVILRPVVVKRAAFIILSILLLFGGVAAAFLNCTSTPAHSHGRHEDTNPSHAHFTPDFMLAADHATAEIHCSKLPHRVGQMLKSAGPEPSRLAARSLSRTLSALAPSDPAARLRGSFYRPRAPDHLPKGSSYRLLLSVFQI